MRFKKIRKIERKIKEKEEKILWEFCNSRTSNVTLELAHKRSKGSEAPTQADSCPTQQQGSSGRQSKGAPQDFFGDPPGGRTPYEPAPETRGTKRDTPLTCDGHDGPRMATDGPG